MPIAALPETTARAISSSQVLTDTASLVKELVDNALDARASSIVIEISLNALDVIQVKDNGHGIAPEDRGLLCQHHCTSKIKSLHDVSTIGGISLGFRGEALASATEMSGSVIVTTRIEGEPVAASLTFNGEGKIINQGRVSHPIGTTVRIVDFLKYMPVRKQTALKTTAKAPAKVKAILQAYALARPSVRFSFKVLRAQSDRDHWMYAPKAGATVTDASLKVINQQAVAQCQWCVWTSPATDHTGSILDTVLAAPECLNYSYTIESLLPRKDCEADSLVDFPSINRAGHYISIDSRPVSCNRGTLKQALSMFRSYLQSSRSVGRQDKLTEPFIFMNVVCPPGSYDPNIEPAKDDVLFTDPDGLIRTIETFLISVYGMREATTAEVPEFVQQGLEQHDFRQLLSSKSSARPCAPQQWFKTREVIELPKNLEDRANGSLNVVPYFQAGEGYQAALHTDAAPAQPVAASQSDPSIIQHNTEALTAEKQWKHGMYDADEEDPYDLDALDESNITIIEEDDIVSSDITNLNPWTLAKLNAPVRRAQLASTGQSVRTLRDTEQLLTPVRNSADRNIYSSPGTEVHDGATTRMSADSLPSPVPSLSIVSASTLVSPQMGLPFSTNPRHGVIRPSIQTHGDNGFFTERQLSISHAIPTDFVSAKSLPAGTPLKDIPDVAQRPRKQQQGGQQWQRQQGRTHKPFVSPLQNPGPANPMSGPPRQFRGAKKDRQQNDSTMPATSQMSDFESDDLGPFRDRRSNTVPRMMHPDLAVTMDFEERKRLAMQRRKEQQRQQTLDSMLPTDHKHVLSPSISTNSPHQNRYNKAIAALSSSGPPVDPSGSAYKHGDPRAHLARALTAKAVPSSAITRGEKEPPKRSRTANMPFEKVPAEQAVHDLVQEIRTSQTLIVSKVVEITDWDDYVTSGVISSGIECTMEEAKKWEETLLTMLERTFQKEDVMAGESQIDLWSVLQRS